MEKCPGAMEMRIINYLLVSQEEVAPVYSRHGNFLSRVKTKVERSAKYTFHSAACKRVNILSGNGVSAIIVPFFVIPVHGYCVRCTLQSPDSELITRA